MKSSNMYRHNLKHQFILFLLGLLALAVSAFAQVETPVDIPIYRLRELTPFEFIHALPDFEAIFVADEDRPAPNLINAAEAEFLMRFGKTATFNELQAAFERLRSEVGYRSSSELIPVINMNEWIARLLERWLSESPEDFSSRESINNYPFEITVVRHDFDLDGEDEWILDVQYLQGINVVYHNFLVADGSFPQYDILPVPVPYKTDSQGWATGYVGNLGFRDITGDGQPEWLFSVSKLPPGGGGYLFTTIFTVYALGWHEGEFVRLYVGSGEEQNVDDDAAMEFVNTETATDNWICGMRITEIWDWDGMTYVRQSDHVEQLDCTAREAEEAMWAGDFATAAERYETYFGQNKDRWAEYIECGSTRFYDECGDGLWPHIPLYFLGRRIIAYALLGNTERVQQLLDEASSDLGKMQDWPKKEFIDALIAADTLDARTLCQTAYDYFTSYQPIRDGVFNPMLPGVVVPPIVFNVEDVAYVSNPARSGCDIALFSGFPTPTPTSTPTPYPTFPPPTPDTRTIQEMQIDSRDIYNTFRAEDYETAGIIIGRGIAQNDSDAARWHYWRAMLYEALDRPDDALSEYINLYLNYPGSWWAWLASLHFERVER